VDALLENAQRIFDVARSDESAEPTDFALMIRPDGGLHIVMEPLPETAAIHDGARISYRVSRTSDGVRVVGRSGDRECMLQEGFRQDRAKCARFSAELLRDQPLYRINSPLTISAAS
jgi:hypothetical protein